MFCEFSLFFIIFLAYVAVTTDDYVRYIMHTLWRIFHSLPVLSATLRSPACICRFVARWSDDVMTTTYLCALPTYFNKYKCAKRCICTSKSWHYIANGTFVDWDICMMTRSKWLNKFSIGNVIVAMPLCHVMDYLLVCYPSTQNKRIQNYKFECSGNVHVFVPVSAAHTLHNKSSNFIMIFGEVCPPTHARTSPTSYSSNSVARRQ